MGPLHLFGGFRNDDHDIPRTSYLRGGIVFMRCMLDRKNGVIPSGAEMFGIIDTGSLEHQYHVVNISWAHVSP